MKNEISKIIDIIDSLSKDLLISDEHMAWTSYDRVADLKKDLKALTKRLAKNDLTAIEEIELFFAPTGVLQEVSINGMWGLEFIEIGNEIDKHMAEVKKHIKK